MLKKGFIFILVSLGALPALSESDYYTWVDENGITNYAERKPDNYQARYVTRAHRFGYREPDEQDTAETQQEAEEPEEVDPDKIIAAERAKFEAELAEEKRFNCDVGKKNLTRLETFARIRIKDENGNERIMTREEMDAKEAESRQLIRDNCTV